MNTCSAVESKVKKNSAFGWFSFSLLLSSCLLSFVRNKNFIWSHEKCFWKHFVNLSTNYFTMSLKWKFDFFFLSSLYWCTSKLFSVCQHPFVRSSKTPWPICILRYFMSKTTELIHVAATSCHDLWFCMCIFFLSFPSFCLDFAVGLLLLGCF